MEKKINLYLKEVKKGLIAPYRYKKKILTELRFNIDNYMKDNDVTDFDEIIAHFGTADELASYYLSALNPDKIRKSMKIAKWIRIGVLFIILFYIIIYILAYWRGSAVEEADYYEIILEEYPAINDAEESEEKTK